MEANAGTNFILLSCSSDEGLDFLESSLLAGILKSDNKIVIPCLGLKQESLDKFRYLETEITVLKLQGSMQVQGFLIMSLTANAEIDVVYVYTPPQKKIRRMQLLFYEIL